jgi:hypothetical protein
MNKLNFQIFIVSIAFCIKSKLIQNFLHLVKRLKSQSLSKLLKLLKIFMIGNTVKPRF